MRITIIGTGYVGLVSGTCFAEYENTVYCVDNDKEKIEDLKKGKIPIFEPDLESMLIKNLDKGNIFFTTDMKFAMNDSDICFICVGTPQAEDGATDLRYVLSAARDIGDNIEHEMMIVIKSTVPIGTAYKVSDIITKQIQKRGVKTEFSVASNPEFLKEGNAVKDCMHPDRIIVGVDKKKDGDTLLKLYKPFTHQNNGFIEMDIRSAEMTKYAANAMLATKVSFMNEIANICERLDADVNKVRIGIGSDDRIGNSFIYPGIGYGGSCFPKDVRSLIYDSKKAGCSTEILSSVDKVNEKQKLILCTKIKEYFGENLSGRLFAVWGLAYKPNTDDIREAPSLVIIKELIKCGARIRAYDPEAMCAASNYFTEECKNDSIELISDKYSVLDDADALLLLTEWSEFSNPDFPQITAKLNNAVIFDGRNQYDDEYLKKQGIQYFRIGNKQSK